MSVVPNPSAVPRIGLEFLCGVVVDLHHPHIVLLIVGEKVIARRQNLQELNRLSTLKVVCFLLAIVVCQIHWIWIESQNNIVFNCRNVALRSMICTHCECLLCGGHKDQLCATFVLPKCARKFCHHTVLVQDGIVLILGEHCEPNRSCHRQTNCPK